MADPFYNSARWQRVRRACLMQQPLCVPCQEAGRITVANVVDHDLDRKAHPALAYDMANLVSMCISCHSIKTARGPEAGSAKTDRTAQPRKGCDASGLPLDPAHPWKVEQRKAGR